MAERDYVHAPWLLQVGPLFSWWEALREAEK